MLAHLNKYNRTCSGAGEPEFLLVLNPVFALHRVAGLTEAGLELIVAGAWVFVLVRGHEGPGDGHFLPALPKPGPLLGILVKL